MVSRLLVVVVLVVAVFCLVCLKGDTDLSVSLIFSYVGMDNLNKRIDDRAGKKKYLDGGLGRKRFKVRKKKSSDLGLTKMAVVHKDLND